MMDKIISMLLSFLPCAFDATDMNRIHGGTVGLWLYKSADAIATIIGSGYFDAHVDELRQGDTILISSGIGGTVQRDSAVVTSADNATPVTVYVKV